MSVQRPTFNESWYRIADVRPRLRSHAQICRQRFRGQRWYVMRDPSRNSYSRISEPAYYFIGLLDGRRTVAAAWRTCAEQRGDEAPTQGEVIQLLGRLYAANLLQSELPGDAEALLRRYQRRVQREWRGYLSNPMCVRIPLFDPNGVLERVAPTFGWLFSRWGALAWMLLLFAGFYSLAGRTTDLALSAQKVLSGENLALLYLAFAGIKLLHELGHGLACKHFGIQSGTGGEVRSMGITLLVLMPVPFVEASSAWALNRKWQRVVVACGGMYVELAVAAVAAIVWANTAEAAVTHAVAYNVMLIAGVSTLLFNGNPLLRYDAYYVLSDALEIPNLAQRSQEYVRFLVKRYVWGVDSASSPAHLPDERKWLVGYAVSATLYRIFVCAAILLFLLDRFFVIGTILAAVAVIGWLVTPFLRLLRYLVSSSQLARCRGRALATSLGAFTLIAFALGVVRIPQYARAEGIVEPRDLAVVHAAVDGIVKEALPSGVTGRPDGPALVQAANPDLAARYAELQAELREHRLRRQLALDQSEFAAAQAALEQLTALERKALDVEQRLNGLHIAAPFVGTWLAPKLEHVGGVYLRRGDPIGTVVSLDDLLVRAFADQAMAAQLYAEACESVEIRALNRPASGLTGSVEQIFPAGGECLPTSALGTLVGGKIEVAPDDPSGVRTTEPIFEIRVRPDEAYGLLPGQRVVVRFRMKDQPLGLQLWQSLSRVFQRRFNI